MRIDVYHHIILPEPFVAAVQAGIFTIIANQEKTMSQNDDLAAAVAGLQTSANNLSASVQAGVATIEAELAKIAAGAGDNQAVTDAIANIKSVTEGMTAAQGTMDAEVAKAAT